MTDHSHHHHDHKKPERKPSHGSCCAMQGHDHHPKKAPVADAPAATVYICPMHPHITGEEGDNCPICGMHLVPKNEVSGSHEGHGHALK